MNKAELRSHLKGLVTTPVVPMNEDGSINLDSVADMTRFYVQRGLRDGIGVLIPLSGTGEFMNLSDDEYEAILATTVEAADGEVVVFGGGNHMNTRGCIERARRAKRAGAAGVMVGPPFYFRPTREEILEHYRRVSEAVDNGIILYNNAFATQYELDPELVSELADLPNVVGIKDSSGQNPGHSLAVVQAAGDRIAVLCGAGEAVEPAARKGGADGFVSPMSTIAPELSLRLEGLLRAQDWDSAADFVEQLRPLLAAIYYAGGGSYLGALKAGLEMRGIKANGQRTPFQPLSAEGVRRLAGAMERLGVKTTARQIA